MYTTSVVVYTVVARDLYPEETIEIDYNTCSKKCYIINSAHSVT